MKLSDFLSDVGRPVAFYPSLVKALGDRNEAIFICQMAYWRGKGENKDDWIYKTAEEIEAETSLTYKEQTNVRDGLKSKGLLQEYHARTEHKMYFRVGWDKVNSIWEQFTDGKVVLDFGEGGSLPEVNSLNSNTETTQENTPEIEKPKFDEELADIGWTIHAGKKVTKKQLYKTSEKNSFEEGIEIEMKRLRLNWVAFDEKAKDTFRRFIRALPAGQSLNQFVSWWLEDEWRTANPPWTLAVIMQRWLQAFEKPSKTDETRPEYQPFPFVDGA